MTNVLKLIWWTLTFRAYKVLVCKYWEENGMVFKYAVNRASETTKKRWEWLKDRDKKERYSDGSKPRIGDTFEYLVYPENKEMYWQKCEVIYWDDVNSLGAKVMNGDWIGTKLMPHWNNITPTNINNKI